MLYGMIHHRKVPHEALHILSKNDDSFSLQCSVKNALWPEILYLGNVEITGNGGTLLIHTLTKADFGIYQCIGSLFDQTSKVSVIVSTGWLKFICQFDETKPWAWCCTVLYNSISHFTVSMVLNCDCWQGCLFLGDDIASSEILDGNTEYIRLLNSWLASVPGNGVWRKCFHAKTDGWAASTFHEKCDNKPHTVSIIKVGVRVFGGYADVCWKSCEYALFCSHA